MFLSTPSGWRATSDGSNVPANYIVVSIHALRVEGDSAEAAEKAAAQKVSIHALRVEGDAQPPANVLSNCVSIHALRVEGD